MNNNKLYIGDNLEVMKKLTDNSVDCIITDPPYNTTNTRLTYKDNRKDQEWLDFMEPRLIECHRVLKKTGTMLIFIDSNMQAELQMLLYKVFNKRNYITTFIWKKKSSSSAQSKFATVEHDYIIAFAKDIKHCKWNGIPQFEKKDITTELKIVGNIVDSYRENQDYPLYATVGAPQPTHGDDPNDKLVKATAMVNTSTGGNQEYPLYVSEDDVYDAQRLDKVSKTDRNPETRPEAVYSLYVEKTYKQEDEQGYYTTKQQFDLTDGMKGSSYPLYVEGSGWKNKPHFEIHQDGYGQFYHHPQCGTPASGKARPKSDDTYPLYVSEDHGQRISLTPFPGSVEIKPMNGKELGCWRCIPKTCQKLIDANMLVVKKNKSGDYKIYQKQYANYQFNKKTGQLEPFVRTTPIRTILQGEDYPTNLRSNKEIKEIYGKTAFTYCKPRLLIKNLLKVISNEGDTILDIFAGSGTTGCAAFELKRQFTLIQIDENNIPDLTKIRLDKEVGPENYEIIR